MKLRPNLCWIEHPTTAENGTLTHASYQLHLGQIARIEVRAKCVAPAFDIVHGVWLPPLLSRCTIATR